MIVVGIDPGTWCGWAVLDGETRLASGVWDLRPRRHEGGGMRYLRTRHLFSELLGQKPVLVGYEEVRRHMGVDAAHVYAGIVSSIVTVCEEQKVPYTAIPVGTVKKLATGKGNAKKDAMIKAAEQKFAPHEVVDDNEADALWIAVAAHLEVAF